MARYKHSVEAEAYQVYFSERDKEIAKKGLPAYSHGTTIRYDEGQYSVLVGSKHAYEGEWVVTENGQVSILGDESFKKEYTEIPDAPAVPAADPAQNPADVHPLKIDQVEERKEGAE